MNKIKLFTIGFTKKKAETFFNTLNNAGVKRLLDIRLNNVSQLAGFAKKNDLIYFLKEICNCDYKHLILMAPTQDILDDYKKNKIKWSEYVIRFNNLINNRKIENLVSLNDLNFSCLLCSEPTSDKCHRRLVAEYLQKKYPSIEIIHL